MARLLFGITPLLLILTLGGPASAEPPDAARPNVVFIVADDLGWTDLGCYGSDYYQTPHIDRLAAQGMTFTAAYANPNCAPTRASLLTGRYTPRHGVYTVGSPERGKAKFRDMIPPPNNTRLAPAEHTFAEAFQSAGYATAHMGKWHMGTGEHGPLNQGFDINVAGNQAGHPKSYFSPYKNPDIQDGPEGEYLTDRLTDEAVQFITDHRDQPFLLYLPYYAVHTPIQPKKDLRAKYEDLEPVGGHDNPGYAAMIETLDRNVGRILQTLEELDLTGETIVLFSSDNGGVGGYGDLGGKEITANTPLRGGKGMLYEGGVRVPLIVRYPGVTDPGGTCDEPVKCIDFHPTFLDILGAAGPPDRPIDGLSFLPLLQSAAAVLDREAIYWHFPGYLQASTRRGTWRTTPAGAIRRGDHKLIEFFETGKVELYNLAEDIGEQNNLAEELPEKARQLRSALAAWRKSLDAPMPTPKESN